MLVALASTGRKEALMRTLALALSLSLTTLGACTVGEASGPDPDPDPDPDVDVEISGVISADATWAGEIQLLASATIASGVSVTIVAGSSFIAADGAKLTVEGTLLVAGTAAEPVSMVPAVGAVSWAGMVAESGGSVTLRYATGIDVATLLYCHAGATGCAIEDSDFEGMGNAMVAEATATLERSRFVDLANGGVTVRSGGELTIVDTTLLTSSGDIVVQQGGDLVIDHSEVGGAQGSYEHCDLHIGSASSVTITNSNIISGVYGMMIGGTTNAVIQYNNWEGNDGDISEVGINSNVDLRYNYWDQGAPSMGAAYDTSSPASARLTDAGPRI
jgi:hypothetical protein